jgi:hypothetical protein
MNRFLNRADQWATATGLGGELSSPHRFAPTHIDPRSPLELDLISGEIATVLWHGLRARSLLARRPRARPHRPDTPRRRRGHRCPRTLRTRPASTPHPRLHLHPRCSRRLRGHRRSPALLPRQPARIRSVRNKQRFLTPYSPMRNCMRAAHCAGGDLETARELWLVPAGSRSGAELVLTHDAIETAGF